MAVFAIAVGILLGQDMREAASLYERTEYQSALTLLQTAKAPGAPQLALMGKCHLMLGDYKKATQEFQKAIALDPRNSDYMLWLGRTWGRRAETASPLVAPGNAAKARDSFEQALQLDPNNRDAMGDLFDYYLDAPGFLGGGADKAEALAQRIEAIDPPEGHFLLSEVARKRKQPSDAERELRLAVKMGPTQVGHVIALARFLARQSRLKESDAVLAQAERVAPGNPRVIYAKASIFIETHRNIDQAKALLQTYLQSPLTPDDPPRAAAEKLLKTANGA
jgi:tetratricopeptide (TPR) repeat protein